jgi:hypothetical protein
MGLEGIVLKRLGSIYRSGRSKDWLKFKNPDAPTVKREAEEDWSLGTCPDLTAFKNRPRAAFGSTFLPRKPDANVPVIVVTGSYCKM